MARRPIRGSGSRFLVRLAPRSVAFEAYDGSILEGAGRILLGLGPQGEGW